MTSQWESPELISCPTLPSSALSNIIAFQGSSHCSGDVSPGHVTSQTSRRPISLYVVAFVGIDHCVGSWSLGLMAYHISLSPASSYVVALAKVSHRARERRLLGVTFSHTSPSPPPSNPVASSEVSHHDEGMSERTVTQITPHVVLADLSLVIAQFA